MRFKTVSQKTQAFTLVEIMVVISIIGILVGILVLNFDTARKHSRDNARKASLKQIQLALETYKAQNGEYPAKGCGITSVQWIGPGSFAASPWGATCDAYAAGLAPDFISVLPTDPNQEQDDGKGFVYQTNAAKSAYKVSVQASVETDLVTSLNDEFARCPYNCGSSYCGATPQSNVYSVYSKGAECW